MAYGAPTGDMVHPTDESNTAATITLAATDDSVEPHVPSEHSERVDKVD